MHKIKTSFLWLILLGLIVLPLILGILYIYRYSVNVPWWDEWFLTPTLLKNLFNGTLSISDFFVQHNESRPFFPRIIMLLLALIFRYNIIAEMFASYLIYCSSFIIIFLMYKNDKKINMFSILLFAPIVWFFFNSYKMFTFLYGMFLTENLMFLGFVLAVYFLDLSKGFDKELGYSIVAAIIATFSFVAGLAVWPVCLIQIILKESNCKLKQTIIWCISGLATLSLYLFRYSQPMGTPSTLHFIHHPITAAQIFFYAIGNSIMRDISQTYIAGILVMILAVCIVLSLSSWNTRTILSENIKWLSFVLFSIFACGEIVVGRSGFGSVNAYAIRYYLISSIYIIGLYFMLINNLRAYSLNIGAKFARFDLLKKYGLLNISILIFFVLMLLIAFYSATVDGAYWGPETHKLKSEMEYYLKTYEIQPDSNLKKLCDNPMVVRSLASFLREHRFSVFSEKDLNISNMHEIDRQTIYNIEFINNIRIVSPQNNAIISQLDDADEISISGWAIDALGIAPAKAVYIALNDREPILAQYGLIRDDVAIFLSNGKFKFSGFRATFVPSLLLDGRNNLTILIVASNGTAYYRVATKIILLKKNS